MGQITLRDLEPEIEKKIRGIARGKGKSLNQVIKEIIHKELTPVESPAGSLVRLAGGWTREEAAHFVNSIKPCEQIDEEMWK